MEATPLAEQVAECTGWNYIIVKQRFVPQQCDILKPQDPPSERLP